MYTDLLDVLNPANVEVSDARLKELYEIAFRYGLDMSHWDERLLEYRKLFHVLNPEQHGSTNTETQGYIWAAL